MVNMASTSIAYRNADELKVVLYDSVRPEIKERVSTMSSREIREFAIAQIAGGIKTHSRILPEELTQRFDEVQINLTKLDNNTLSTIHKSIDQIAERFQKEIEPLNVAKIQRGATKDIDREIAKHEAISRDRTFYLIGPLLNTEEYLKPRESIIGMW